MIRESSTDIGKLLHRRTPCLYPFFTPESRGGSAGIYNVLSACHQVKHGTQLRSIFVHCFLSVPFLSQGITIQGPSGQKARSWTSFFLIINCFQPKNTHILDSISKFTSYSLIPFWYPKSKPSLLLPGIRNHPTSQLLPFDSSLSKPPGMTYRAIQSWAPTTPSSLIFVPHILYSSHQALFFIPSILFLDITQNKPNSDATSQTSQTPQAAPPLTATRSSLDTHMTCVQVLCFWASVSTSVK